MLPSYQQLLSSKTSLSMPRIIYFLSKQFIYQKASSFCDNIYANILLFTQLLHSRFDINQPGILYLDIKSPSFQKRIVKIQLSLVCISDILSLSFIGMNAQKRFLILNKYQIDYTNMLGKGAMAKVYLGYYRSGQSDKNTMFAVKQILINSSTMIATDALLQQINLLRKITHPYILKYIDAKKTPTSLFLFIQYCNKGTLEDFILEHREGLSDEIVRRFVAQIIIALKFLKERNIIHRDIKPKNILIHEDGIKLADFGVAKIINNHNSDQQTTSFSGTIQFMSPQILRQEKYTFATDMWSLGVTIFFVLFERLPWNSNKVIGILKELQSGITSFPQTMNPDLRDLVQRMLEFEQNDRITVQQAMQHPYLQQQIKKLQAQIANADITYESKQITKTQFMMNSLATSDISPTQLQRRSIEVNTGVRASQFTKDLARQAYRKLSYHKDSILFLKDNLDYLRACNQKKRKQEKKIIPEGLFRKCQFLLVKRCYIIAKDLQQIFLFGTYTQGNITIPKKQLLQLMQGRNIYSKTLRSEVDRLYDEFKDQWSRTKQSFYSYQRSVGVKMRPRQDAYLQNLIENRSLILAFNDCFLDLFFYLSKGIIERHAKNLSEDIPSSLIILTSGVKIEFIYDIMIILCLPNVIQNGVIKNYRDKKKRVPCQEYIYRISIAYKQWSNIWQPQQNYQTLIQNPV